jgi:hypothetical protein
MANLPEIVEVEQGFFDTVGQNNNGVKYEEGTIITSYIGRHTTPCLDGTPAPQGLNLLIKFDSYGHSGFTFIDEKQISRLLKRLGVNSHERLLNKKVGTYNLGRRLVGITEPSKIMQAQT